MNRENGAQFLVPRQHLPAFAVSIAAVSCISLTLLLLRLMWSFPGEEPVLCLGSGVGVQDRIREGLMAQSSPHCPCPASGYGSPLLPPAGRLLASQHLSLPETLLTPPQCTRMLGRLTSPAPPSPGQQVCVLSNLSLPSEGLRN